MKKKAPLMQAVPSSKTQLLTPILMFMLLLGACQLPEGLEVPQSPLLAALEAKSGLIAYVGSDGNIYTMDQGGGNIVAITEDAQGATQDDPILRVYQHPTWAPNSERLAFFSVEVDTLDASQKAVVYSSTIGPDPEVTEIYSTRSEIPFYSYWAPNSDELGFLSFNQAGSTMLLNLVNQDADHRVLDAAQPYYWNWAPEGQRVAIHAGSPQTASLERISFLDLAADGQVLESVLDLQAASFQAPAWSPSGEWLLLAIEEEGERSMVLVDRFGSVHRRLLDFDEAIAFGFSPDGQKIAALVGPQAPNGLLTGSLHVFELDGPEEAYVSEEDNIMSFFWAPNSNDLAYFQLEIVDPNQQQEGDEDTNQQQQQPLLVVNMQAYAHNTGETRSLTSNFLPTERFLNVLTFFNQYQHSATIWSPDSQNLVFSAQTQEAPIILVISASGSLEPRVISNGVLAFWSWD